MGEFATRLRALKPSEQLSEVLFETTHRVHRHIKENLDWSDDPWEGWDINGASLVGVVFEGSLATVIHVGIVQACLYRAGRLVRLTEGHTMFRAWFPTSDASSSVIEKARGFENVVAQYLGANPVVSPEIFSLNLKKNDVLLISTDGFYQQVSEAEMIEALECSESLLTCQQLLFKRWDADSGGDDATLLIARVTGNELSQPAVVESRDAIVQVLYPWDPKLSDLGVQADDGAGDGQ